MSSFNEAFPKRTNKESNSVKIKKDTISSDLRSNRNASDLVCLKRKELKKTEIYRDAQLKPLTFYYLMNADSNCCI